MPSIQEIVNRNRGVTVYNPVRPILPRGIANAGTARRILQDDNPEQRRQQQIGGGGGRQMQAPQMGPTQPLPVPGQPMSFGYAPGELLARVQGAAPPQQEEQGGFLGTVIGSGPGRAIMGALNVLDYPRRIVVSGVQEAVDAINGGDASWNDFTQQVSDPTFGFGDIIGDTGNKWVNRFLGFTGDVLLDPLTYLAGSSLISGVGRGSRVSTAAAARAAGMGEEIAQRIGRYGTSVLDNAERQMLRDAGVAGIRDAGYYFRVPLSRRVTGNAIDVPIPGTGMLERGVTRSFAQVRGALAGTRGATALRRWRSPAGLEDAWRKILTGDGAMPFNEAAALVTFADAERMARGTFIGRLNAESRSIINEASSRGLFGTRAGNEALSQMIHTAETSGGTLVNDIFDSALKMMREVGVNRPGRKLYVPHLVTEGAQQWMRGDTLEARYLRDTFFGGMKIDDVTPSMMERRLVPGPNPDKPFIINGKEFYIREGTIKEFNEQFARLVPDAGFKFFEDDFSAIISRYAHSMADDVGLVAGVRRLLNSKTNFVRRIGDETEDVTEDVINDVLNRYADPEMAEALRTQLSSQNDTVNRIRENLKTGVGDIKGELAVHGGLAIEEMSTLEDEAKQVLQDLYNREAGLVAATGRGPADMVGPADPSQPTQLEIELQKQLDRTDKKLEKIDVQAAKISADAAAARQAINERALQEYPRVLQQWDELNSLRARLHQDAETLATLKDQVEHARAVARRLDNASENPSFLNLALGDTGGRPRFRAGTESDVSVRTTQTKTRINDEHAIRLDFSQEREKLLATADTRVQELEAAIEVQSGVLARAQQNVDNTIRRIEPHLDKAIANRDREQLIQQSLLDEAHSMIGDPTLGHNRMAISKRAYDHRKTGELAQYQRIVNELIEEPKAAYARLDLEQRRLDDLASQRDQAVKEAAKRSDPIYSARIQEGLRRLNAREKEAVANARKAQPIYAIKRERQAYNYARGRRFTQSHYEGGLPQFMEPTDRADLINAHLVVRDTDRTTEAGQKLVRDARDLIKRIEKEYEHALTPRQRVMRNEAQPAIEEAENRLRQIRELREHPYPFPRKGTPERDALMPTGDRGGDFTPGGRAARALNLADEELAGLPLDAAPEELGRAILDHDLVAHGIIDSEFVHGLINRSKQLREVADQYSRVPMPHLRGNMENLTRDTVRDVELMSRIRIALERGLEVDDRMVAFIAHRQLKAEDEALDDLIARMEGGLSSQRQARRETEFEIKYNLLTNEIAGLRLNRDQVIGQRAQVKAAMDQGDRSVETVQRMRSLNNDLRSLKQKIRRAETNLYKLQPPRLNIVTDDVDTMVYALADQLEQVIAAQRGLIETERFTAKAFRPVADQEKYLQSQLPTLNSNMAIYTERARRIEAAIAKAEGSGKDTVGYWNYEPSATGRQWVKMDLDEAQRRAAKNRQLEAATKSRIRNVQLEIDVITGKSQMRIDKIDRLILDQQTPPDIKRLQNDRRMLTRKQNLTPGQQERLDFINERLTILQRGEPLSADELGALQHQREFLSNAQDEYAARVSADERYARSILDDGQQFFEDLLAGNRDITHRDMVVLYNLYGGDAAQEVRTQLGVLKEAILNRETISHEELRDILDDLALLHGDRSMSDYIMEQAIAAHPDVLRPSNEIGREGVDVAEISVGTIRGSIKESLIAAAQTARMERTRELAEFLKLVGFSITDKTDTRTEGIFRAMGQDLGAVQRQTSITGRKTASSPIDRQALRQFVINQLLKTGWSQDNSIRSRIMELRTAQQRIRRMRRGLGSIVQGARVKNENAFFRWLSEIDNLTRAEEAGRFVSDADRFRALLLPEDMETVFRNRKAALQDDLKEAIATNNAGAIDEVMRRIEELETGARTQGVQVEAPPPATIEEATAVDEAAVVDSTPAASRETQPTADVPQDVLDEVAEEREVLEAQLNDVNDQIILARANPDTSPAAAIDHPAANRLRKAAKDFDKWSQTVDLDNLTVAERRTQDEMMDNMLSLQMELRSAGIDVQEVLAAPAPAVSKAAVDVDQLLVRQGQIQAQLDQLDQRINEYGLQGGDPSPPPPPETDGLTPPDKPDPIERLDVADEDMTLQEIDDEFEQVASEYQQLTQIANPLDKNAPPEIVDAAANLSARARTLRAMRREKMNQVPPPMTPDYVAYSRVKEPQRASVSYNWRSIWKSGAPSVSTVRQLKLADIETARRVTNLSEEQLRAQPSRRLLPTMERVTRSSVGLPMPTVGALQPTGVGMPLRDSLIGQEYAAGIVQRERERLRGAAREQRETARNLTGLSKSIRRRQGDTAREIQELEANIPALARRQVDDLEAQRLAALDNRRQQLVTDREKAEDAYTTKLTQLDADLAETRIKLSSAKSEVDRLEGARTRIESVLKQPVPESSEGIEVMLNDLRDLAGSLDSLPPEVASNVAAMLDAAVTNAHKLGVAETTEDLLEDKIADFARQAEAVSNTVTRLTADGMRQIASDLVTGADSLYIAETMATSINNLRTALKNQSSWKLIGGYTSFFKTYATMRPGFHVRNMLSAIFMNYVDNVQTRQMWRALREYRKFKRNPAQYWEDATPQLRDAFIATWGSGSGGQFSEYGLGGAGKAWARGQHKLMNNFATRMNRRAGEFVEGTVRLGMALDSLDRGQSIESALERITRYHFDYTQVSQFDRTAKQLIPFWTFMSRNLPLQIESMWLRPRTYLQYQSFVRNFAEAGDPLTPEYWLAQGAFTMDENAKDADSPWFLALDLPHLRVAEPFQAIAQGETGKAMLQDFNPLFLAPYEAFITGEDAYTGRPMEGYERPTGPMTPLLPLLQLLGGAAVGGTSGDTLVDERYAHIARSVLPPLDQLERYLDNDGTRAGRQDETVLRALGAPIYQLTPELRESTRRRQFYDERDAREARERLARQ